MGMMKSRLQNLIWPPENNMWVRQVSYKSHRDSDSLHLTNDLSGVSPRFKVVLVYGFGYKDYKTGVLDVTPTELVFWYQDVVERSVSHRWPLSSVRRFGFGKEFFTFECGRRCPSGEGLYIFKLKKPRRLHKRLQDEISRICANDPCIFDQQQTSHQTTSNGRAAPDSSPSPYNPPPVVNRYYCQNRQTRNLTLPGGASGRSNSCRSRYRSTIVQHRWPTASSGTSQSSGGSSGGSAGTVSSLGRHGLGTSGATTTLGSHSGGGGEYLIAAPEPPERHSYVNQPSLPEMTHTASASIGSTVYLELDHSRATPAPAESNKPPFLYVNVVTRTASTSDLELSPGYPSSPLIPEEPSLLS